MSRLIRGAVLEGCSAAGKTSVLKALKRLQAELGRERSVVILSEHYSQALQKVGAEYRRLERDPHRKLLSERLDALESLAAWGARSGAPSREAAGVLFALERFHLNHRVSYPDDEDWIESAESRLARLGGVCFLLTVSEASVPERLLTRLRSSGKAHDASQLAAATREFLAEQETLARAAERSSLATVTLRSDDRDWDRCAREILDRLEQDSA